MIRWLAGLLLMVWGGLLKAETPEVWRVSFKDKNGTPFQISRPQDFLSPRSIERRNKQQLSIDESDLPVSPAYLDSIAPLVDRLIYRFKWSNSVIFVPRFGTTLSDFTRFAFVKEAAPVHILPPKQLSAEVVKEEEIIVPMAYYYSNNRYGLSYRQTNMLNLDLLHARGYEGDGMLIAVMDNGFHRVDSIPAFDTLRNEQRIIATRDMIRQTEAVYDSGGHGTSVLSCMAGILPGKIRGTAPYAQYMLLITEDDRSETVLEEYYWAAAAEFADSMGADVFNTSLGYTTFDKSIGNHTYADLDGQSTISARAANQAALKGILVVNSAGNSGDDNWKYIGTPADANEVLAIGAVDSATRVTDFSSFGPNAAGRVKPDLAAMGSACGLVSRDGVPGRGSGTSFAGPILAGAAACLWQALPQLTAIELRELLKQSGHRYRIPDDRYGYGIPDLYAAWLSVKENNRFPLQHLPLPLVYPNPVGSEMRVMLTAATEGNYLVELYAPDGRRINSLTIFLRESATEIMDLSSWMQTLPAGEYLLKTVPGVKQGHIKIIKN